MGIEEASRSWRGPYDVFLSFRGEDTRSRFTDHLYNELLNRGIRTFRDDLLERREGESAAQSREFEEARIPILLFSKNYASSNWSLEELIKILEVSAVRRKQVLPIFYDVSPSDVRNQTGKFAAQFKKYEEIYKDEPEKVLRWRAALTEVANLSGWDSKDRCESELIKDIVKDVWKRLNPELPFPSSSKLAVNSMPSTPSSSSSSSQQKSECVVFISFRGSDTRKNFFGHLYNALVAHGISTFRDNEHVEKGKPISSELVKAIKESKICLVILSPNFASSTWCLDELSEMLPRDSCELTQLRLLVNYNGKWANSRYIGGKTQAIRVSKDITYGELEDQAYRIVGVYSHEYKIVLKAKYESKQPTEPAEIIDDESLKCFMAENLSLDAYSRMPLCITLEPRKDDRDSERSCGSVAAGERMKKIRTLILLILLSCFHLILLIHVSAQQLPAHHMSKFESHSSHIFRTSEPSTPT